MGGSVSAGTYNDDLIDNLIEARYIRTPIVEKVFRTVDRAFYFLPEFKYSAYQDLAWKHGNLHLSAPCIYSEVLEHLSLEPGQSFLNIGSGTGYLNTMVGLILGSYGVNHGIEIQPEVVDYAYEKLEQFKTTCNGVDVFEFCEPQFIVGNIFDLNHERKYDRIYCGAACPEMYHDHIKKHMKIGGILIMPCEDDLLKTVRHSENSWEMTSVLSVSFSTLLMANKKSTNIISMPDPHPLRLQELCRATIRSILRGLAEKENAELTQKRERTRPERPKNRRHSRNPVIIPVFEEVSRNDIDGASRVSRGRLDFGNIIFHNYSTATFRNLIRYLRRLDNLNGDDEGIVGSSSENGNSDSEHGSSDTDNPATANESSNRLLQSDETAASPTVTNDSMKTYRVTTAGATSTLSWTIDTTDPAASTSGDTSSNSSSSNSSASSSTTPSAEEISNSSAVSSTPSDNDDVEMSKQDDSGASLPRSQLIVGSDDAHCSRDSGGDSKGPSSNDSVSDELPVSDESNKALKKKFEARTRREGTSTKTRQFPHQVKSGRERSSAKNRWTYLGGGENAAQQTYEPNQNIRKQVDDDENEDIGDDQPKKLLKREKLDSGISEESDDYKISRSSESSSPYSESTFSEAMDLESDDSIPTNRFFSEENAVEEIRTTPTHDSISLKYRKTIEPKIQALPLPQSVKIYLNYNRPFEFCS